MSPPFQHSALRCHAICLLAEIVCSPSTVFGAREPSDWHGLHTGGGVHADRITLMRQTHVRQAENACSMSSAIFSSQSQLHLNGFTNKSTLLNHILQHITKILISFLKDVVSQCNF